MNIFNIKSKHLFSLLLFAGSALSSSAQITNATPYCSAGYDGGTFTVPHYIKNVTFGTLNNTSGTTQYAAPHYVYYNNITAPNVTKGNSYNISVANDGGTIHFLAVYIDFNKNNSFTDAGELVLSKNINAGNVTNPSTGTVVIPATAATGTTRMRVMVFEDDNYTWTQGKTVPTPCTADATGSLDWGETEDYDINITGSSTGSKPVAGFKVSAASGTPSTTFAFTDTSLNAPTSWQWSFVPNNVTYVNSTTATSANPQVKFTSIGKIAVKLKVTNAAGVDSVMKADYINVGFATQVENVNTGKILLYPNPAGQTIYANGLAKGSVITISSTDGKTVRKVTAVESAMQVSLADIPGGIYIFSAVDEDGNGIRQLFVKTN